MMRTKILFPQRGTPVASSWLKIWLLSVAVSLGGSTAGLWAQPFDLRQARRAVVRVLADRGNSEGSGVILKVEGKRAYVLTARHVVAEDLANGVAEIRVEFFTEETVLARLSDRRTDIANDLAVLIIDNLPSTPSVVSWGSSGAMRDLDRVYAIGHPVGGPGWGETDGTVSRLQGGRIYFSGTAVSPGNSGGPLLNALGVMVGLNLELSRSGQALETDVMLPILRRWIPGWPEEVASVSSTSPPTPPPAEPAKVIQGKDGKEMRLVPEGWFEMGSTKEEAEAGYQLGKQFDKDTTREWFEAEQPRHRVWVDAFYMDTYEVTVGEYEAFRQATKRPALPDWAATYASASKHPVVGVSWDDAMAYCKEMTKRLPTEAEWEKAARGTDRRLYPWGNAAINGQRANYCDSQCSFDWKDTKEKDGYQYTAPVGSYPAGVSPYGIHDLAGNVWEWVQDWYDAKYYSNSPERNPANENASSFRVLRGGSWYNPPALLRTAYRGRYAPAHRLNIVGFRCVAAVAAPRR